MSNMMMNSMMLSGARVREEATADSQAKEQDNGQFK